MRRRLVRVALLGASATALALAPGLVGADRVYASAAEGPDASDLEAATGDRNGFLPSTFEELSLMEGFESGGFQDGSDDLEFYWHGELPEAAKDSIHSAEASGRDVHIVSTAYSYDEIWAMSLELVGHIADTGIAVDGFGPNRANDTIELMGPELSTDEALQDRVRALAVDIVPSDITIAFLPDEAAVLFDVRP